MDQVFEFEGIGFRKARDVRHVLRDGRAPLVRKGVVAKGVATAFRTKRKKLATPASTGTVHGSTWRVRRGLIATAAEVANRARQGDSAALQAFGVATDALAEALDCAVSLFAPELVVLGGGLSGAMDLLGDAVTTKLQARLTFQRRPVLSPAVFGADAGVVGAGLLGWERLGGLNA